MSKFRNRYRIESARLKGWDYSSPAWYFVTICTAEHRCIFGRIRDGILRRSSSGEIVAEEWVRTETIRWNVRLDEWVVMPNHVHGIIEIVGSDEMCRTVGVNSTETPQRGVSTSNGYLVAPVGGVSRLASGSLGAIIGQFKTVCTKRIRKDGRPDFGWQARFHDHIIRDEDGLRKIRRYIRNNPAKWASDRLRMG